jgi:hypothetical protein
MSETASPETIVHGARRLPAVEVESYNVELKDNGGFLGDRANKSALRERIDYWRKQLKKSGDDPLGDEKTEEIGYKKLDGLLKKGDERAAGALHGAIEDFSNNLVGVIRRLLSLKDWKGTERLMIGGGLSETRIGELIAGRTEAILNAKDLKIDLRLIRFDPDEAGLVGAAHLAPAWIFKGHDAILGVDIGGTNLRAGLVELNLKKADDLSVAKVWKSDRWRHADEKELGRKGLLKGLVRMLEKLVSEAESEKLRLAPFIGVGCPGRIDKDGSIETGAQNLPGDWESSHFNLPHALKEEITDFAPKDTMVVLHNDAVVQGLSEVPFMQDVRRWGVLTIGTGLGNARFTNRHRS